MPLHIHRQGIKGARYMWQRKYVGIILQNLTKHSHRVHQQTLMSVNLMNVNMYFQGFQGLLSF